MKPIGTLIGLSSCCIAIGATAARAEPLVLGDAALDRVAAGYSCMAGSDCPYPPGSGLFRHFGTAPLPFHFAPDPGPLPGFTPTAFPPFGPVLGPQPEYCGPACDPGPGWWSAGG